MTTTNVTIQPPQVASVQVTSTNNVAVSITPPSPIVVGMASDANFNVGNLGMVPRIKQFSGHYETNMIVAGALAGAALSSSSLYLVPLMNQFTQVVTSMDMDVTVPGTGGFVEMAIYASDPTTGYPIGSPIVQTAPVSVNTTGLKSGTITPTTLNANTQYWIATLTDGNPPRTRTFSVQVCAPLRSIPTSSAQYAQVLIPALIPLFQNFTTTPLVAANISANTSIPGVFLLCQ